MSGVRIDGLNRVVRDLRRAGVEVDDLKDAFQRISEAGVREVRARTPRRSGRLAADVRGNRAARKAVVRVGSKRAVPYAGPINYGWRARNIEPSRFMQRGDEAIRPIAEQQLETEINALIRRIGLGR